MTVGPYGETKLTAEFQLICTLTPRIRCVCVHAETFVLLYQYNISCFFKNILHFLNIIHLPFKPRIPVYVNYTFIAVKTCLKQCVHMTLSLHLFSYIASFY